MDDVLFVRGLECVSDLARDGHRVINRDRFMRDPIRKREPVHELQHERANTVGLFDTVNMRDVGMVEGSKSLGFALEPR